MRKTYNKKLKKFRLNTRLRLLRSSTLVLSLQLLTLHLYLGPNQSLSGKTILLKCLERSFGFQIVR